ncbi:electron transport complex subunit RsxC [Alteromonas facilis]|uniref:electron transport complex subunit RsxC n=1 Tax=Alteromonas facilis TaxID=2048004 RepID=UPI000C285975|nr:electron transport complex subunit RsxC [Alteromonas facilis]
MAITPLYDDIIAKITHGELWQFPGGVHPPQQKSLSNSQAISTLPLPDIFYIPIKQHSGVEGELCINIGDHVLKGQALTRAVLPFSVPVHAPSSGVITDIGEHTSAHPSGMPELTITLQPDGKDTWIEPQPVSQYQSLEKSKLVEIICDAGIAGLGGAGFPSHIKANSQKPVEFLIINGIECEPYITSDDRLMREHAWQIRQGIEVLSHLLEPKCILVAIEDNKPDAINALTIACQDNDRIRVVSVPTKYPAGGEKQLIQVLTGREVPRRGLPGDIGCVMFNVGTCYAIADTVFSGKPLIERVVTLTGNALKEPQNVWALLGTPVSHLLAHAGYKPHLQQSQRVIMGGPMMGFTLTSLDTPVVKITNCLLVPEKAELTEPDAERNCIRCGYCTDACPASLLPQQLFWYSKSKEYDKAQEYNLFDCIECGACAYVCPSEIPLVHYYRVAKADIRNQQEADDKSEKAKQRFEARKARLLEEKRLREEKHRLAAEQRKQALENNSGSDAKDKIAAALARAKAKKSQTEAPVESDNSESKQSKVAAAIARAKAKKQALAEETKANAPSTEALETDEVSERQAKVKAAVARAKAKKQAAETATTKAETSASTNDEASERQAKVKAAVARAKAKKQAADVETVKAETPASSSDAANERQAKVKAAVAKAKAKKQAAEAETVKAETGDSASPKASDQDKKEKIARAIAKAKAKKDAAQNKSTDS